MSRSRQQLASLGFLIPCERGRNDFQHATHSRWSLAEKISFEESRRVGAESSGMGLMRGEGDLGGKEKWVIRYGDLKWIEFSTFLKLQVHERVLPAIKVSRSTARRP